MGAELTWRLEGGYSRFIEGSRVELRLEKKPFRHSLDVSPSGFIHRSQPIDLIFRVTRGFTGRGPGAVRWRVRPHGQVRSVILFAGMLSWEIFGFRRITSPFNGMWRPARKGPQDWIDHGF